MNRPRIVAILSAMLGSTAGFLVLSRWRLAGTVTGAFLVPAIYTLVSHCSHESLEHLRTWSRRRLGKAEAVPAEVSKAEERPVAKSLRPASRGLNWSVATLALLAFAVSVYSLTHSGPGVTILRERVVETVTVSSDRYDLSAARSNASDVAAALGGADLPPTTAVPGEGAGDPPSTTVSTVAVPGDGSTQVTLPPTTSTTLP